MEPAHYTVRAAYFAAHNQVRISNWFCHWMRFTKRISPDYIHTLSDLDIKFSGVDEDAFWDETAKLGEWRETLTPREFVESLQAVPESDHDVPVERRREILEQAVPIIEAATDLTIPDEWVTRFIAYSVQKDAEMKASDESYLFYMERRKEGQKAGKRRAKAHRQHISTDPFNHGD